MNLLVSSHTEFGDGEKAGQVDEDSWWDKVICVQLCSLLLMNRDFVHARTSGLSLNTFSAFYDFSSAISGSSTLLYLHRIVKSPG
jgi:hypothetical protein